MIKTKENRILDLDYYLWAIQLYDCILYLSLVRETYVSVISILCVHITIFFKLHQILLYLTC